MTNPNPVPSGKGGGSIPQIKSFEAGSFDTLLSAERANEIVKLLNALAKFNAGKGLKITASDARYLVELVPKEVKQLLTESGDGGASGELTKILKAGAITTQPWHEGETVVFDDTGDVLDDQGDEVRLMGTNSFSGTDDDWQALVSGAYYLGIRVGTVDSLPAYVVMQERRYEFKVCMNGQSYTFHWASLEDPTTIEPDP